MRVKYQNSLGEKDMQRTRTLSRKVILALLLTACVVPTASAQDYVIEKLDDVIVQGFADQMCEVLYSTRTVEGFHSFQALENTLLSRVGFTKSDPNYKMKMVAFWNYYNDRMICSQGTTEYPRQHIYRRAIELRVEKYVLFGFFLKDPVNSPYNINAVEYIADKGVSITVIDFIDSLIKVEEEDGVGEYDIDELEELRETLMNDYGAKRYKDL